MKILSLVMLVVVLAMSGCAHKRVDVNALKLNENRFSLPGNLRMTLVNDPERRVSYCGMFNEKILALWGLSATKESYSAAKSIFERIGSVSDKTTFRPHLIIEIESEEVVFLSSSSWITPTTIINVYWGTGEFFKTYKTLISPEGMVSPNGMYNLHIERFKNIVNRMLRDTTLAQYFRDGFDDSLTLDNPNVSQIPYLRKKAEARARIMNRKGEVVRQNMKNVTLAKLRAKLSRTIEQEQWEDAKNIQSLIQSMEDPSLMITGPSQDSHSPSRNRECERARKDYNQALKTYNRERSARNTSDGQSTLSAIGAMGGGSEANLLGLLSNVTRRNAATAQRDMNHALSLVHSAQDRMSIHCN